jgi:hypothetical protein
MSKVKSKAHIFLFKKALALKFPKCGDKDPKMFQKYSEERDKKNV